MNMNIDEMRSRIMQINNESAKVNNMRSQNIGRRDTLEKQCAELSAQYKAKYGVDLTPENLQEEINRVMQEKVQETNLIAEVLSCVSQGNFDRANELMGVSVAPAPAPVAEVAPTPVVTQEPLQELQLQEFGTPRNVASFEAVQTPTPQQTVTHASSLEVTPSVPVSAPVTHHIEEPVAMPPEHHAHHVGYSEDVEDDVAAPVAPPPSFSAPQPQAPIPALQGFTSAGNGGNLGGGFSMPNLDTAQKPSGQSPVMSFSDILGNR